MAGKPDGSNFQHSFSAGSGFFLGGGGGLHFVVPDILSLLICNFLSTLFKNEQIPSICPFGPLFWLFVSGDQIVGSKFHQSIGECHLISPVLKNVPLRAFVLEEGQFSEREILKRYEFSENLMWAPFPFVVRQSLAEHLFLFKDGF